ncbi:helix-turn-helix domain-containing protein [Actinobacillus equuli subsp. equuli]|uniref:Helix-turn-helix domain-containing protein n=1 Tax=Actinobacillus equuli subsp. equuli TaxID=202947 RepID=A0A9X4G4L6_ACTEU|nr:MULTISPECIES: helix-turn-helix transcriptional regulator [Actinobacillus]MDE8035752.1 helix-turn-helix domain-containing protein [Actinobacillus equuli subsp. equuli]
MNKLAEFRNKIGISQLQLAQELNCGQGRISNYELGTRTPSLAISRKLVEALNKFGANVSIDDVFPPENRQ